MTSQVVVLVPSKEKKWLVLNCEDGKKRKKVLKTAKVAEMFDNGEMKATLLGIMGGPGQALFIRAQERGLSVHRIPRFRLQELSGIQPKSPAEEQAEAILNTWEKNHEEFYPLQAMEEVIALVRQLTRVRLGIQDFRKRAQLQFYGALRELRYILPAETEPTIKLIEEAAKEMFKKPELRKQIEKNLTALERELPPEKRRMALAVTKHFANPRFILGAKKDEVEIEKQITALIENHPLWPHLHPKDGSVLPQVKGFGPSLGGSILTEIDNISRFPSPASLRAYARFHVGENGEFPHRKSGEVAAWNDYLNRAMWLWSTDQMPRYKDHPWRTLYEWKKAKELQAHPNVVPKEITDKRGRKRIIYLFTLKHCDSRAKRWVGSALLNYLWDLWTEVERGTDPEVWYPTSSWPAFFQQAEKELDEGLRQFLEQEIERRRRSEPKEEEESKEEN